MNRSVLAVIWVKECVDDKVRDATFLEGVAGVLDYEEVFEKTVKEFCVCLIRHLSKSRDTHITGHGCGGILREKVAMESNPGGVGVVHRSACE